MCVFLCIYVVVTSAAMTRSKTCTFEFNGLARKVDTLDHYAIYDLKYTRPSFNLYATIIISQLTALSINCGCLLITIK